MANTLDNIMPKILANGLAVLREQVIMPQIVNGDYSAEAARKGTTIDVPIPAAKTASDVTPAPTYSSASNTTPGIVQISLNNWKHADFFLTDKDQAEIERNAHFMPMEAGEAIRALANAVNQDLHQEYAGVYGYVGTADTTPFASTVTAATDARKVLNQQLAPRDMRRAVVNYDAEANILALSQFSDFDKINESAPRIEGIMGRKYGFDWYADDHVLTHTAGSLAATGAVVGTTAAVGASTLAVKSASAVGNVVAGDIFTIAGDSQTYVVQATVSAIASGANKNLSIDPPLKVIASAAAAITFKASHVVNIAFHRNAFAFANRPLMSDSEGLGSRIMSMTDPVSGITLRLEVSRQYKQTTWDFDILWGAKLVRPALATRIAG